MYSNYSPNISLLNIIEGGLEISGNLINNVLSFTVAVLLIRPDDFKAFNDNTSGKNDWKLPFMFRKILLQRASSGN